MFQPTNNKHKRTTQYSHCSLKTSKSCGFTRFCLHYELLHQQPRGAFWWLWCQRQPITSWNMRPLLDSQKTLQMYAKPARMTWALDDYDQQSEYAP